MYYYENLIIKKIFVKCANPKKIVDLHLCFYKRRYAKFITENITRGARKSMSFLQYQKESPEFLNNYLKYKRYIDFGAQTTIDETFYDLRCLFRYIKLYLNDRNKLNSISKEDFRNIEITDVTIADLERMNQNDLTNYLFFLDNTLENISKTRNRKLASMKRLYEYLETNNLINVNPTKWMQSATIEKRQPKYLDLNESKQLLANAINSDCRYKIRNYAITCLFLNCSLRLSELVGINLSDLKIDNSEQTLKVTGKGNKQRIIYLNSAVCEAINAYIKIRPKLDKSNKDYNALFLSSRGKRISKRSVQNIIKSELVELVEAEGNEIRSLNNSDIYSFIFFLAESHYQNNSRVIKIEHLKTFFDYLFNIKHTIFKEPFKKINSERKLEKKLPNYLSLDEAKRLINLYKNSTDEIEIRDNAMLHIFLNCGLRLSEIKNLNIEDINLDDNKFTIIGKGNKERTNYLNKKTKDALIKYLKIRDNSHDNNKKHNNALFLTFYGYRMSQFTINKIVKRAYRKAELDENVYTVHTLRHTCATLLYRSGVNIKTIQELLGHVHIDTTEIYTHLDNQEVKDVMFEHPLAQFKMEDALAYCA